MLVQNHANRIYIFDFDQQHYEVLYITLGAIEKNEENFINYHLFQDNNVITL